ncbi:MAG: putative rane protein [Myxococcales bacterium]|nr:putative rane protein [Myxococcales bacterium]
MGDGTRKRRRWLWVLIGFIVLGGGAAPASHWSSSKKTEFDPTLVVTVDFGSLPIEVIETGKVQPRERVEIKSKVAGQVQAVFVDAGDRVKKGQRLLRLDPTDYLRDVAKSRAEVMAAANALKFASQKLARSERGLESRAVAQIDLEAATSEVEAKRAALTIAKVAHSVARDRLRYTEIVSSMNGTVTARGIQPGEVVTPGVQATFEGKPLLTVADLSTLIVQADLNQIDVAKVKIGQKVTVTLDALPGKSYSAVVSKIAPASVTPKGKDVDVFPVEATLDNGDGAIKPGMTADVRVHIETRTRVLVLPVEAIVREQGKDYVNKLVATDKGKKTERVEVKVGRRNDHQAEIAGGLGAGDQVLIDPSSSAANEYSL